MISRIVTAWRKQMPSGNMTPNMRHACFVAAAIFLAPAGIAATINGVVKDPSGAVVSGAAVELREVPGPGSPKNVRTDAGGHSASII
jgi:hypothetical protein